jgi:hypothetical protein
MYRADIPVTNTNAATPTVDPNDANAAAAAITEPQLPAGPGNSNSSSNSHIAMSLLASMQLNQVDFASLSFPRFCVVLVDPYIVVRADPMNSSSEVRTIKSVSALMDGWMDAFILYFFWFHVLSVRVPSCSSHHG